MMGPMRAYRSTGGVGSGRIESFGDIIFVDATGLPGATFDEGLEFEGLGQSDRYHLTRPDEFPTPAG